MTTEPNAKKEGEDKKPSPGFLKFQKAMAGHDSDVSAILNCHLVAEYYLDQVIHACLPRGDALLLDGHLTFFQKVQVIKALDATSDAVISSLKGLNRVRNSCSHEMDYKITEADIDKIGMPFGKEYLELKRDKPDKLLRYTLMKPVARLEAYYERKLNSEAK